MKKKLLTIASLSLMLLTLTGCKGDPNLENKTYKVKFVTNNSSIKIPTVEVKEGYHITGTEIDLNSIEELSEEAAIFRGWYSDPTFTKAWNVDEYRVSENMTLYAKWSYPQAYPSEVEISNDAFANSISWIQDGVTNTSTIQVKLLKANVTDKQAIDPNTGEEITYESIVYPVGPINNALGNFEVDGYFVKFTFNEILHGGVYRAYITTNTEKGVNEVTQDGIRFKGTGTSEDPYLVYSEQDLVYLTTHSFDEGTHAILKSDISIHSIYNDKKGCIYDGELKGNGKTITLMNNSGLFYELGPHSEVYGVKFNGQVSGSDPSIGVLANYNSGYIHNVQSIAVSVYSDGGKVNDMKTLSNGGAGGIVGTNKATGEITECIVTSGQANVIAGHIGVGGIAGINYGYIHKFNSTTTPCSAVVGAYNGKEISSSINTSYAGCAVGVNYGLVEQVNVDGKINCRRVDLAGIYDSGSTNIGGVVGYNAKEGIITECLFQGMRCVGDTNVGGISGYNDGLIKSCFTGRRVRKPSGTTIEERMFISPVVGSYYVGGIAGKIGENSTITNCFSTANVYSYAMQGYTIAEKCDNCIGINTNQNPRLTTTYLGQKNGQCYSNDLLGPQGTNNKILDNSARVYSAVNNLLGADFVDGANKQNTQLTIEYLTLLGDKFGWNNTYGISLLWQSSNTHPISYYGG